MRDESSPFLDEALPGIGAGIAGALTAFSLYAFQNSGHPNLGDAGPQLAAEILSFTVVVTALIAGLVGVARTRIGRFPAIFFVATVVGPPAVSFATARFGTYPIPFVGPVVVVGGLFVTFLFLVKRLAPSARVGRIGVAVLLSAVPFAVLAALAAPFVSEVVVRYQSFGWYKYDPAELGAIAGCVIGPLCGLWICLAVWMSAPKLPARKHDRLRPGPESRDVSTDEQTHEA